ncbi:MAG TPA: polysaccharide deacetylase family protein, partial [Gemmatimonadota bacterium]|nr:polysaccharide deacetylase family protein [Gemmatimonadota bacterium]
MPRPSHRLAVLRYRRVGPLLADDWLTSAVVEATRFEEHLRTLRRLRWTPITGRALVAGLADPRAFPERAVLVTFEGGYRSFVEHALPALERYRVPTVLFVATDRVGMTTSFEPDVDAPAPVLDWDELATLPSRDVEIQSMGTEYRRFSALAPADIEHEAADSRAEIARRVGQPPTLFAYPGGEPGADVDATAR